MYPNSIIFTLVPPAMVLSLLLPEATLLTFGASFPVIIISCGMGGGMGGALKPHKESCPPPQSQGGAANLRAATVVAGTPHPSYPPPPCQGLTCTCAQTSFLSLLTWYTSAAS